MRISVGTVALSALALVLAAAPVLAQGEYGESTWTSRGFTWTAALDEEGNPVRPGVAHVSYTPTAAWSQTRTRHGLTQVIGYDDDDDPMFTRTLSASSSSRTTTYPYPTTVSSLPESALTSSSSSSSTVYITPTSRPHYESISGYYPPKQTPIPSPSGYTSGSILRLDELPGYNGQTSSAGESAFATGRPVYGGNKVARRAVPIPRPRDVGPPGRVRLAD